MIVVARDYVAWLYAYYKGAYTDGGSVIVFI
jgi:hypothetical protein